MDILIAKYLNGECNATEIAGLEKWRYASPEHELVFLRSEEAWYLAHTDRSSVHLSKVKVWKHIRQHISERYSRQMLLHVAGIAASISLIIGFGLSYLIFRNIPVNNHIHPQQVSLSLPGGVHSQITLPDSTRVWLNASSTIRYPNFFDGETRTIELSGEAFFDVTPDKERPFMIKSGDLQLSVLGTSFNFKHYPEDTHAVIAVEAGAVTFCTTKSETLSLLSAGKYATIDNHSLQTNIYNTPSNYFSSWRNNKIIFRDEAFGNVLNELSRRYNVDLETSGSEIQDYIYTATFDNMTLEDVLWLLKLSSPIDYSIRSLASNNTNVYKKRKVTIYRK